MRLTKNKNKPPIKSWQQFAKLVRSNGCNLLNQLNKYPDPVLVSGCQRSGGTMLAGIISHSQGMVDFAWSKDDELDAALILSGYADYNQEKTGRHCFQTTYLNECYTEYFQQDHDFKLIWLLRNPYSVVYSLLHNWKRFALNELFLGCGVNLLPERIRNRYDRFGLMAINRLSRACLSYNAKISQISHLIEAMGTESIMVVDYDDLIMNKDSMLPTLYDFIDLPYQSHYADSIRTSSLSKASNLSRREREMIDEICMPVYKDLSKLAIKLT